MRLALLGHSCSPCRGSEPGVTWNWATHLLRYHDVTLVTHPIYRDEVDAELAKNPRPGLTIHWLTTGHPLDRWVPGPSQKWLRLHYRLWQGAAYKLLRKLHQEQPFDLVHSVSWASLQQPTLVWKLGIPFVWGPLGGGQVWPASFLGYAGSSRKSEQLRRLMVRLTRWNLPVVRAVHHADLILATNRETGAVLDQLGAKRVEYYADFGVQPQWLSKPDREGRPAGRLHMLFGGRCEPRKGLALGLEAMSKTTTPGVTLTVAGDGPDRGQLEKRASDLGLGERVKFLGEVPWERMQQLFSDADALLFPSLRDSQGTVVLEAMARRLPLLTLDHQGVGRIVPAGAAIKAPVSAPEETVTALARGMDQLAAHPQLREAMGQVAFESVAAMTWDNRAKQMTDWYEEIVRAHRGV